jgi:hypothetical protein
MMHFDFCIRVLFIYIIFLIISSSLLTSPTSISAGLFADVSHYDPACGSDYRTDGTSSLARERLQWRQSGQQQNHQPVE